MKTLSLFAAVLCAIPLLGENGALNGRFSVDTAGHQIVFSQGNLQYNPSSAQWKFADNQNDFIGFDNANITDTYEGWIDLFSWGTGNQPAQLTKNDEFVDWGANIIENGGKADSIWRSLSYEEWQYMLFKRERAAELVAKGRVNGVNGLFLMPDDWDPNDTLCITDTPKYADNIIDSAQWMSWEEKGAVFLPACGCRLGKNVTNVYDECNYWADTTSFRRELRVTEDNSNSPIAIVYGSNLTVNLAMSVRLAQDYIDPLSVRQTCEEHREITSKYIRNGQLLIIRNNRTYNAQGIEIK
ncbi:MAG: hypothetical protein K6A36_04110 [Paludibacteraceae bacterium]|nr:hypothetical protein [Paludibacteraceae bacterium]